MKNKINKKELVEQYQIYKSTQKVAEIYNCSKSTIRSYCKLYKININDYIYPKIKIGSQFGKLKVIKYLHYDSYECLCDCGKINVYKKHNLKNGNTKSCGCSRNIPYYKSKIFKGYQEISGKYWSSLISSAKRRNIIFDVNIEYAWDIFLKQNKKCAYSGVDLKFSNNYEKTASLDRINSNKGYIIDNIQWTHKYINVMKLDFTEEGFLSIIKEIYEYRISN